MTEAQKQFFEWKLTIAGTPIPNYGFDSLQDDCMFHVWQHQQQRIDELESKLKIVVDAFTEIRNSLQFANDSPNSGINDTLWMMDKPQTIFDAFDEALKQIEAKS